MEKARAEYEKYRQRQLSDATPVERHFETAAKQIKQLEKNK
jgi:hypothetical protein